MGTNAKEIAAQARRARVAAGLTQAELAKRTGTTQSAVSRLESGRLMPTLAVLERVAEATGTPITVVVGRAAAPMVTTTAPPPARVVVSAGRPLPSAARDRLRR